MMWPDPASTTTRLALTMLLCLGVTRPLAAAEDERSSACATSAEQAQQLRSEHKLQEARKELLECAQASCPTIVRTDCVQWLSEVDRAMPSIVIKASDPSKRELIAVRVWIDSVLVQDRLDGLARSVNPGIHRFRFEANGMVPLEEEVVVREGEDRRMLTVELHALVPALALTDTPMRPTRVPVAPMVLAGVGLAALGSFAYFGLTGRSEASRLADGCGADKSCSEEQVDPVRKKLFVADVSLGISVVTLGIATYLWLSRDRPKPTERANLQFNPRRDAPTTMLGLSF